MRSAAALVLASSAAWADPPTRGGRTELAVGASVISVSRDVEDSTASTAHGPALEAQLAWHDGWWSVAAYGLVATDVQHVEYMAITTTYRETLVDLGARADLHAGPAFGGLGLGIEEQRIGDPVIWLAAKAVDAHAGVDIEALGPGIALEIFAGFTLYPLQAQKETRTMTRFGVGVRW